MMAAFDDPPAPTGTIMTPPDPDKLDIGASTPDFELPVIGGQERVRLSDLRGQIVVLDFWSHECPWSQRYDGYFAERVGEWAGRDIRFVAVNSNANEPDEAVLAALAERGLPFAVLRDAGHTVADAYGAITTPHVYVVDREGRLAYRGAVDDLNWQRTEPDVRYLDEALADLLAGCF